MPSQTANTTTDDRNVTIDGDVYDSNIITGDGNTINQTRNIYTGDQAYDVRGLENPYLGLKTFSYDLRARYAGRDDEIAQALQALTTPGQERTLLFITGASGSGKSSFAQAGLLPALEEHYQRQQYITVAAPPFRPGAQPLAGLAAALRSLNLAAEGVFAAAAPFQLAPPANPATDQQISLLLIDQFEELFTQSDPAQRADIIALLTNHPSFRELRMHIIATLRVDYLPELFAHPGLYEQAKAGLDLHAMSAAQLEIAIQRPMQALYPNAGKRWQEALVKELANEAAKDAAYLPLLQVALQEIWAGGLLTVEHYTSLTDAIRQHADAIVTQIQTGSGPGKILAIFLDLVDVSLDDNQQRDVRRTRLLADLTRGQPEIEQLIDDLVTARLLSTGEKYLDNSPQPSPTIDIIHESLIHNWPRLQEAIQSQRAFLKQRSRFELRLAEWLGHNRSNEFLLTGVYLTDAENLQAQNDVAVQSFPAREYLAQSVGQRNQQQQAEIERQREEIEQERALAAAQALRAEEQTRRAEAEQNRARTFRWAALITSALLIIALLLGFVAYDRQQAAEASAQDAMSRTLVAQAQALRQQDNLLPVSMLLAIEAQRTNPSPEAEELLRQGLTLLPPVIFSAPTSAKVTQVAYSGDGQWMASADEAGTVQIRNAHTGALQQTIQQPTVLRALAFNPMDSQQLAAAGNEGQVCLWDITTGKPIASCIQPGKQVNQLLYSADGQWLAMANRDGKACLWGVATRQSGHCLAYANSVNDIAISPDNRWLAAVDDNGSLQVWDIAAAQQVAKAQQGAPLLALAFSRDGKLATADGDGVVQIWEVTGITTTLRALLSLRHNGKVNDLAFNPDDKTLATVSDDHTVRLWDVTTGWEKARMEHTAPARVVTFSPNGRWLATASADADHTARVWDAATGQEIARLVHDNEVRSVVFSPDGQQIATGSTDRTTKVWALPDFEHTRIPHAGHIWAVAYHPQLQQFVTTSDAGFSVTIWDTLTGQPLNRLPPNRVTAQAVAFSQDGVQLAVGREDKSIGIWRLADKQVLAYSAAGEVRAVAFSLDGQCLASGGVNRAVQVRPLGDRCILARLPYTDTVTTVTYSPTGQWLATASRSGLAHLMQVTTGALITISHGGAPILAVAISPDEKLVATAGVDRRVHLWQIASGGPRTVTLMHNDEVRSVAFSPDGRWLATGSADGTARLWSITTGKEVVRLQQRAAFDAVVFSPDGQFLVTSSDKLAQVWEVARLPFVPLGVLVEQLCLRLPRNLTQSEWGRYFPSTAYRRTCPDLP